MTKFNRKSINKHRYHVNATRNFEGGLAFKFSNPKTELINLVATNLIEDKYYEASSENIQKLYQCIKKCAQIDPEFVLQVAGYARTELYLRSIPIFLTVVAANLPETKPFVRKYTKDVIQRADEVTETIACQLQNFGKPIPNCIKKALSDALDQFDEYQFNKYFNKSRSGNEKISLKTVLRLIHKKPINEKQETLLGYYVRDRNDLNNELIKQHLPLTYNREQLLRCETFNEEAKKFAERSHATWETLIAKFGSTKETWESVISNMGYMARLRNLRNFIKNDINIDPILNYLTNPKNIEKSKQLPFRFLSAYKMLEREYIKDPFVKNKVLSAINTMLELSVRNIPKLNGKNFFASDNSGSMLVPPVSPRSIIMPIDVSCLMTAMAIHFCEEVVTSAFGTRFKRIYCNKTAPIMQNYERIRNADVGWATNGYLIVKYLLDKKIDVDRIFVFTDMELYDIDARNDNKEKTFSHYFQKYKRRINPDVYLYFFNLANYGHLVVPENEPKTIVIGGWSDGIFKFIKYFEQDRNSQVHYIQSNLWRSAD